MNLQQIFETYGSLISAAAAKWNFRPEVIAGIIMRESNGVADAIGSDSHGRGLMQLDDRDWPGFCSTDRWKDPASNILAGCMALTDYQRQVEEECQKYGVVASPSQVEQMSIAGYNCGPDHAVHCLRHGMDIDTYTTGKDYSRCVLEYAATYAQIAAGQPKTGDSQA